MANWKVWLFGVLFVFSLFVFALTGEVENTGVDNIYGRFQDPRANHAPWNPNMTHEERLMTLGCAYPGCTHKPVGVFRIKTGIETSNRTVINGVVQNRYESDDFPLCELHEKCNEQNAWPWPEGTAIKQWSSVLLGGVFGSLIVSGIIIGIVGSFSRVFRLFGIGREQDVTLSVNAVI